MIYRHNRFNKDMSNKDLSLTNFVEGENFLPFSLEVLPSQIGKFLDFRTRISEDTRVYLAMLDSSLLPIQLSAAERILSSGLVPVMHFPIRAFENISSIRYALSSYRSLGVSEILLLGGNSANCPSGLSSCIELLESGIMSEYNFTSIGIAGHPEGNNIVETAHRSSSGGFDLFDLLKSKIDLIGSLSSNVRILTQFLFEPRPLLCWLKELEYRNISCPVQVGLAAPASVKTLVKYGIACGIGNSIDFLQKQGRGVAGLFTDHAPDILYDCLQDEYLNNASSLVSGLHFYSFGNFEKLFNWLDSKRFVANR